MSWFVRGWSREESRGDGRGGRSRGSLGRGERDG